MAQTVELSQFGTLLAISFFNKSINCYEIIICASNAEHISELARLEATPNISILTSGHSVVKE